MRGDARWGNARWGRRVRWSRRVGARRDGATRGVATRGDVRWGDARQATQSGDGARGGATQEMGQATTRGGNDVRRREVERRDVRQAKWWAKIGRREGRREVGKVRCEHTKRTRMRTTVSALQSSFTADAEAN